MGEHTQNDWGLTNNDLNLRSSSSVVCLDSFPVSFLASSCKKDLTVSQLRLFSQGQNSDLPRGGKSEFTSLRSTSERRAFGLKFIVNTAIPKVTAPFIIYFFNIMDLIFLGPYGRDKR